MSYKKYQRWIIIVLVSLLTITAIRIVWLQFLTELDYTDPPVVSEGVLDLRGEEFSSSKKTLNLNGEWEFYPSALQVNEQEKQYIEVPSNWDQAFTQPESENSFHIGTYRLRILLNEDDEQTFGLRINGINNASAIYANGELIAQQGNPAESLENYEAKNIAYSAMITPVQGEIDLVILVSNHAGAGGVTKTIRFGTIEAIHSRYLLSIGLQLLLAVMFTLYSIYTVVLYFLGTKNKALLYFSVNMIFSLFSVLTADDQLLFAWFDINYTWTMKITFLIFIGSVSFLPALFHHLYPAYLPNRFLNVFGILTGMYALFILLAPLQFILSVGFLLGLVMIASASIATYILWKAIRDRQDVIFLLLASLFIGVNTLWAVIQTLLSIEFIHYPFDLIFSLIAFTAFWFQRFFQATEETKELSRRLQLEDKRKDEFLISTSHELRNPLHGMMNLTQAILDDDTEPLPIAQKKRLKLQMQISKHLSLLVEDLLDITRLKEDTIQLNWQTISLPSVVTGVHDMLKLTLGDKNVTLQVEIDKDFPLLWGDEKRLVQIMYNLLHNAIKFTEEGTITTSAQVKNGWASIKVKDTGIGIDEQEVDQIFKAYEQVETETNSTIAGLGLGLNICEKLVVLHGGTIDVASILGEGSTFTFTFPIANDESKRTSKENSLALEKVSATLVPHVNELAAYSTSEDDWHDNGHSKLLVVDDDYVNLNIIRSLLETEKYNVITATDADTALYILKKEPIDLVISDVMMPNISGYELTRKIREQYSLVELPVLLVTARARSQDIVTGFQAGANDYLTKPVDALELKARVQSLTRLKIALEEHMRMEGAWLQSQIQPHFLFNTLNTIAALGVVDNLKMQDLLGEFSNYLRLSFDFKNADRVVELEHEIELVHSYVFIEQERFDDRLQVEWDIEPNLPIMIPPLTIQPLVENAIKHGILKRSTGGTVQIQIKKEPTYYEIAVTDDGIGLTKEEVEVLLKQEKIEPTETSTKVGLQNINRRLQQLYNESLIIKSKQNQGTTVCFRIPKSLATKQKGNPQT